MQCIYSVLRLFTPNKPLLLLQEMYTPCYIQLFLSGRFIGKINSSCRQSFKKYLKLDNIIQIIKLNKLVSFPLQLSPWMKSLVCFSLFTPERKWRSYYSGAAKERTATTWTTVIGATWQASWDTRRSGSRPSGRKSILFVHSCLTGQARTAQALTHCAQRCARSTVTTSPKAWCSAQVLQSRLPLL